MWFESVPHLHQKAIYDLVNRDSPPPKEPLGNSLDRSHIKHHFPKMVNQSVQFQVVFLQLKSSTCITKWFPEAVCRPLTHLPCFSIILPF